MEADDDDLTSGDVNVEQPKVGCSFSDDRDGGPGASTEVASVRGCCCADAFDRALVPIRTFF